MGAKHWQVFLATVRASVIDDVTPISFFGVMGLIALLSAVLLLD